MEEKTDENLSDKVRKMMFECQVSNMEKDHALPFITVSESSSLRGEQSRKKTPPKLSVSAGGRLLLHLDE